MWNAGFKPWTKGYFLVIKQKISSWFFSKWNSHTQKKLPTVVEPLTSLWVLIQRSPDPSLQFYLGLFIRYSHPRNLFVCFYSLIWRVLVWFKLTYLFWYCFDFDAIENVITLMCIKHNQLGNLIISLVWLAPVIDRFSLVVAKSEAGENEQT